MIDRLDRDADAPARHLAVFLQLVLHVHRDVDRDRERQPHVAAGLAVDLRIDADHVAVQVEQRPAGVSGVDRDVGLDERHIALARQRARLRRNDAGSDRVLEAERRAHRHDPLADLDVLGMADAHHRQVLRLDLEQRDVAVPIGAYHFCSELPAVGQLDIDFLGAVDHVGVGENVAVGADDEARADAAHRRLLRHRQLEVPEESEQRIVFVKRQQLSGCSADRLGDADVDHGRPGLLGELAEVRSPESPAGRSLRHDSIRRRLRGR